MRHRYSKKILNRDLAHRKALLHNLATSLVLYDKVETTETKAKVLKQFIEKLINGIKRDKVQVNAIRKAKRVLFTEVATRKLLEVIIPRYKERTSGFVRIHSVGHRSGDAAPLVRIEFV